MLKNIQFEKTVDFSVALLIGSVALAFLAIFIMLKFIPLETINISLK